MAEEPDPATRADIDALLASAPERFVVEPGPGAVDIRVRGALANVGRHHRHEVLWLLPLVFVGGIALMVGLFSSGIVAALGVVVFLAAFALALYRAVGLDREGLPIRLSPHGLSIGDWSTDWSDVDLLVGANGIKHARLVEIRGAFGEATIDLGRDREGADWLLELLTRAHHAAPEQGAMPEALQDLRETAHHDAGAVE